MMGEGIFFRNSEECFAIFGRMVARFWGVEEWSGGGFGVVLPKHVSAPHAPERDALRWAKCLKSVGLDDAALRRIARNASKRFGACQGVVTCFDVLRNRLCAVHSVSTLASAVARASLVARQPS